MDYRVKRKLRNGLLLLTVWTISSQAGDGRIEINQALVESSGGFPYTISQPGSYVLTSSLTVPAATTGIIIDAQHVTLDLNGFSVAGPFVCLEGDCDSGSARGIDTNGQLRFNVIRNGQVYGFDNRCVSIFQQSVIERLLIHDCGQDGINTSSENSITYNRVHSVGDSAIFMAGRSSVFAHNSATDASLGPGDHPAASGGRQTAGNYCDDDSCLAPAQKRYYLTQASFTGSQALTACAAGYHMASIWEVLDPTEFRYNLALGNTLDDAGAGPPGNSVGWVRTGYAPSTDGLAGEGNCNNWESSENFHAGSVAKLNIDWDESTDQTVLGHWIGSTLLCNTNAPVWCLED